MFVERHFPFFFFSFFFFFWGGGILIYSNVRYDPLNGTTSDAALKTGTPISVRRFSSILYNVIQSVQRAKGRSGTRRIKRHFVSAYEDYGL